MAARPACSGGGLLASMVPSGRRGRLRIGCSSLSFPRRLPSRGPARLVLRRSVRWPPYCATRSPSEPRTPATCTAAMTSSHRPADADRHRGPRGLDLRALERAATLGDLDGAERELSVALRPHGLTGEVGCSVSPDGALNLKGHDEHGVAWRAMCSAAGTWTSDPLPGPAAKPRAQQLAEVGRIVRRSRTWRRRRGWASPLTAQKRRVSASGAAPRRPACTSRRRRSARPARRSRASRAGPSDQPGEPEPAEPARPRGRRCALTWRRSR